VLAYQEGGGGVSAVPQTHLRHYQAVAAEQRRTLDSSKAHDVVNLAGIIANRIEKDDTVLAESKPAAGAAAAILLDICHRKGLSNGILVLPSSAAADLLSCLISYSRG
jgi:hypothetical protein